MLFAFISPLNPDFWLNLYRHGQFGDGPQYVWLLILVRLLLVVLILLAARIVVGLSGQMIKRELPKIVSRNGDTQRLVTLYSLFSSAMTYVIYFCAAILMLFAIDPSGKTLLPLLSFASVLGLAIGFGAQRLVRDVITGLFILGEGQFDVGDQVTIGAVTGTVEAMELRITRLRDEQGRLYVIANGNITQVFNASRGNVKLPIEFSLQHDVALQPALEAIRQVAEETLREFHLDASENNLSVIVAGMDAAKITIHLTLWVPVKEKDRIEDLARRRLLAALNTAELMLA